jgi:hypothetical protein
VLVHDAGEKDGRHYLVMELVQGRAFQDHVYQLVAWGLRSNRAAVAPAAAAQFQHFGVITP